MNRLILALALIGSVGFLFWRDREQEAREWKEDALYEMNLTAKMKHDHPQDWTFDQTYAARLEDLKKIKSADTIVIGDSFVFHGDWSGLGPNTANFGIAGDTVELLSKRIEDIPALGAKRIYLLIGTNDIIPGLKEPDEQQLAGKIHDLARKLDATILTIPLVTAQYDENRDKKISMIRRLNEFLLTGFMPAIDITTPLSDSNGFLREEYTTDNFHLNQSAYRRIIKEVKRIGK